MSGAPRQDPPVANFDFDDHLLDQVRSDDRPRMQVTLPPHPMVVLGRGSRIDAELDLAACLRDEVPLYRRRGGGCAVVLDPGNVVVSVVLPVPGFGDNQAHFRRISDWLIAALERTGFQGITQDGISDLVLADRKIAGACIYRPPGLLYYSASLLAAPRIELMGRYLLHPPREPSYRRQRPHDEFVGQLLEDSAGVNAAAGAATVAEQLRRGLDLLQLILTR